ncbi:MAG: FHA domain-containing protein [Gemmatimonadaceae bacterium]|nr:FHA domain-containing protein [Gemmatimonadaceae bacterium]NUR36123.1 FHA domain-containing protein [Gemmatimonadaceae bacterium]NUS31473.1 FHA domain-containing protein [Gemmatimonadaceae bacterium]
MIFSILAVLVLSACIAIPVYMMRHARGPERRELPPLIFPGSGGWQAEPSLTNSLPLDGVKTVESAVSSFAPPAVAPPAPPTLIDVDVADVAPASTETVHFRRPSDQAVQILPGRLEVLSGLAMPREIRFVRIPGERPQLILGREPGSSPPHVALPSSTVSRQHARLDFSGGRWGLTNLSRTNPVVVNDETLSSADGERALADGDRIELGDVVLRFSSR